MLNKINYYSGSLTLLSIICAIIFHFTNLSATMSEINGKIDNNTPVIRGIEESLHDKTRDHQEFLKSIEASNRMRMDLVIVLTKLEITLANMK